ncbi:MAG: radical SAM protein [Candidatus Peregrinibacteria bacterium]|nr:radical SAM protein [Candidatus Peregrinibacteria bacterium]MDZ4245382.1 radical SAM protein [Candidatus Gracilibacteria bacterium]
MNKLPIIQETERAKVLLMVNDKPSCNIACTHCFLPYKGVMLPEDVLKIVKELKTKYRIIIAGSETLTNLGYLEAYKEAGQSYILSNGLILFRNPEVFDKLEENGIKEVRMSLHFGIQDELQSMPERIVRGAVKEAKERGFRVQIAVTITPENYESIDAMCKSVNEMGADEIKFLKYTKSGSAKYEVRRNLTDEERLKVIEAFEKARQKYDKDELSVQIHGNFGPRQGKGQELANENKYCPAGTNFFVIAPDKKVYGCNFLMEEQIGELTDDFKIKITRNLRDGERNRCLTDDL